MTDFATFVQERFGGTLYSGAHEPNGHACLHEAINVFQKKKWSDDTSGTLDLRPLNDAPWSSDEARTAAMVPLGELVLAWPSWTPERQQAFAKRVAEQTIRRILPPTLRRVAELVPDKAPDLIAAALRCETEGSESAAWSAAESAESAESAWAAWAARSASAASAAWSAAESAWSARSASAASAAWSAAESAWAARSAEWSAAESAEESADAPLKECAAIFLEAFADTHGEGEKP